MDGVRSINSGALQNLKAAAPAPKQEAAVEPKDSFMGTIGKEMKETALKVGNMTSSSVGGMLGIAGFTLGTYAGMAGGAIFLGALGAGVGPIIASATTSGLWSFITSSFATTSVMANVGIITGGVFTGTGAFMIARKATSAITKLPGMMIGGAIGFVTGTAKAIEKACGGGEE